MPNPTSPVALTDALKKDVQDLVTDAIIAGATQNFQAVTDPSAFLASNAGAPGPLAFAKGITRQVCRAWARGSTPIQGPLADGVYGPLCTPYLASIGEQPDSGRFEPSFPGGQCDGTLYQFLIRSELTSNPASFPINLNAKTWGPITGWRRTVEGTRIKTYMTSRGQPTAQSCGVSPGAIGPLIEREIGDSDNRTGYNAPTFTLVGICSGPDDCGNAPGGYLPPRTVPSLPPLPPYAPNLPGIGIPPIDIDFDADGNINVSIPDLDIDFTVPNPLDNPPAAPELPPNPGEPGTPEDTVGNDPVAGEGDEGQELVGLLIQVLEVPVNANKFSDVSVNVFRGIGYVRMGFPGRLGCDQSAATAQTVQFYHAQQRGLTAWEVVPRNGFTLRVTPYYRTTEP